MTRSIAWVVVGLLVAGCSSSVVIAVPAGCQDEPIRCVDACGGPVAASCNDGAWTCLVVTTCGEPDPHPSGCGPREEGFDCVDDCGNFQHQVCLGGEWACPSSPSCDPPEPETTPVVWAKSFGGNGYEIGERVAVDGDGNVIVAASVQQTVWGLGPEHASVGGYDLTLAKFDAKGALQWRKLWATPTHDLALGLDVDADGNIILVRSTSGNAGHPLTVGATVVEKLTPAGESQWATTLDATTLIEKGDLIAVDGKGRITVWGHGWVTRLGSDGALQWRQAIQGDPYAYGRGVAANEQGEVFVTGTFCGKLAHGTVTLTSFAPSSFDGFLLALSSNGKPMWATAMSTSATNTGADVTALPDGGVAVLGAYTGSLTIGTSTLSSAERAAFLARFGPSGTPMWARTLEGASQSIHDGDRWYVAAHSAGLTVAGHVFSAKPDGYDIFFTSFSLDGTRGSTWGAGGHNMQWINGLGAGPNNTFAVVGEYWSSIDFGLGEEPEHYSQGTSFVALAEKI
ncbi:MAG: hypothetical protein VB934_17780 [Polyangiaceae bacterium]